MGLKVPERYRVVKGDLASDSSAGNNGLFVLPTFDGQTVLFVIVSDGGGWDHVSVSVKGRTPTWEEMEYIKRMFWDREDTVVQFHPPMSNYINCHEFCLHMWRKQDVIYELPPKWMVGL